ncbi:NUDIX hydrolase [Pseudogulbenkiania sp. NH8B]|uniref:NUDIX hydrolase n=1 Tax=Pseudogulbenkiania sp. (strain NH8B) TaxID=748280 RepID=UPI0002279EB4|nr:NUDIX hydrolase [Pseudogulbenkiania sp. NH8B]BAK76104.1 NUDIX hydrolase [Pseudogulbenkiania sp. NH8B]
MRIWKPNVTVAAVIEREGRFLMVEEDTPEGLRLNQPAGHLEHGETLFEAVRREVLEETAWHFEPEALVGIYLADKPGSDITYLRFTFCGRALREETERRLDDGIVAAPWLTAAEIRARTRQHRSPAVALSLEDWLAGQRLPLAVIQHLNSRDKA